MGGHFILSARRIPNSQKDKISTSVGAAWVLFRLACVYFIVSTSIVDAVFCQRVFIYIYEMYRAWIFILTIVCVYTIKLYALESAYFSHLHRLHILCMYLHTYVEDKRCVRAYRNSKLIIAVVKKKVAIRWEYFP